MILSGADNRPPMLDKELKWSDQNKKYAELSIAEKNPADCDMKATNIILQGLPANIYSLVNHHRVAKDLWERVQLLMKGTSLTKQERECKLYDAFDKFTHIKGVTLHKYYLRFTQLINDKNIYSLPPEWSKFVTDVKLVKDLHSTNFDQLHAYLEQHKLHTNESRLSRVNAIKIPLAFMAKVVDWNTTSTTTLISLQYNNSSDSTTVFTISVDNPIVCLNKAMAFLTAVASSRYKSNATRYKGNNASGQARVVKCYNCQGEGHMARQCTQPKRPRNAAWYKEKAMLAEAQEAGQILDEEQLAFLADLGVPDGQAVQTIIPNNAAFQTEDLDTYDSDCDDISNAQAVLMANISNYGSDVISEVPHSETYLNDMVNQGVQAMQDFEQPPAVDFTDNEIHSDSNIIPYSQYLQETQQENVQDTHLQAQQDSMILSVIEQMSEQMINHEKLALKEQVDSLEQNLSKQIKEKECLLHTFTNFKNESKEKEDKYMENEIELEKKIKEFDNILFKVGQSAQTMLMLTKPQAFYDNIHKQAPGYQNLFHLKKAQRI
ncbi:retrovirus-related pol polyprotein from transposon TNT 1-94 [Tanacetum coccineum]